MPVLIKDFARRCIIGHHECLYDLGGGKVIQLLNIDSQIGQHRQVKHSG